MVDKLSNDLKIVLYIAWIDIINALGGMNYECHQRYAVFKDCFLYGFDRDESFDCAITCNHLPKIIFEVENA